MEIQSAFSSGLQGINTSLKKAEDAAASLAAASEVSARGEGYGVPTVSELSESPAAAINVVSNAAINLIEAETGVAASANAVQTAEETLGTIIDIKV